MAKRPQAEADIAETEAAEAASVEAPSPVPGSNAVEPDEPAGDEVPGISVDAMPDAEVIANLKRERDEYLDLAQRTRAELENFRKRSARESTDAERRGRAHVARGLVPAVDSLERALQAAGVNLDPASATESPDPASREVSAHEALAAGVAIVHGEIVGALRAAGVESFDPAGEKFDPNRHEALSARPAANGEEAGIVAETLQRGYSLGDVLIRPARVVVTS
ncbi:MAG: molecular chaperone GrpE [Solirubrobacterales bacterium]|jgi:molecular chaperone GrpE|nr:molecular chaperone GrpE [Solirubrobacterales bacterium]